MEQSLRFMKNIIMFMVILIIGIYIGYQMNQYNGESATTWMYKNNACETALNAYKKNYESCSTNLSSKDTIETQLDECISNAYKSHKERWEKSCIEKNLKNDCSLPSDMAKTYQQDYQEEKNFCLKRYK